MSNQTVQFMAAASLAVLTLAATPASVSAQSVDAVARMTGPDRMAKLEAGAKKEGEFMLYTSLLVDDGVRPLQEVLAKKYPFIKFNYIRATTSALIQRVLAEDRAKKPNADIVIASSSSALHKAEVLQPYLSPEMAAYPQQYMGPNNLWSTLRVSYNGLGYNTKLVSAADAPKSYEDLLHPRWKGKMIWANALETGGPLTILHLKRVWGDKKANEFFDGLAKQNVANSSASGRAVLDLVIAGEHSLQISAALHHVIRSQTDKAPVQFASFDPVMTRPDHIQLLKTSPHPHAAMLFIDYVLSEEGQNYLVQYEYLPAHPKVQPLPQLQKIIPRLNGLNEIVYTPQDTDQYAEELQDIYNKISR